LNPYTIFFCFSSSINICSPPPSASNVAKIAQFNKEIGKLRGVSWNKEIGKLRGV
jgi:hypothetical protein